MNVSVKITVQLIITMIVISIVAGTFVGWMMMNKTYMESTLKKGTMIQLNVNKELLTKEYPTIKVKNLRFKVNSNFDLKDYIKAFDGDSDITDRLSFYGKVDSTKKGIYKVRCVVTNAIGLKTVEFMQIVVD